MAAFHEAAGGRSAAIDRVFSVFGYLLVLPVIIATIGMVRSEMRPIALLILPLVAVLRYAGRLFRRVESILARVARRRAVAVLFAGAFVFGLAALLSLVKGVRDPTVTDEFSYLLAADTFLHGRLANPTHPMWVYFETLQVLQRPTYVSKYPPGQGLVLAAGQVIAGHAIVGVWLSTAAAASAVTWMLMAWMPPRWALLGGLMTAFHPLLLFWSQCYWGGALAMCGGALLVGGFRRVIDERRARDALLMGLGVLVLANSRPYEGSILAVVVFAALIGCMAGEDPRPLPETLRNVLLPLAAMLALTAGWLGYYNWRVTGDPLRLPYMVHEATYAIAPLFIFQQARPEPRYNHDSIRNHHAGWPLDYYLSQRPLSRFLKTVLPKKLMYHFRWNLENLALLIPLVMLPHCLSRDRWVRFALIVVSVCVVATSFQTWLLPHYTAPIVGLFLVCVLQSLRRLHSISWRGLRIGKQLTRGTLILATALAVVSWTKWPPMDPAHWSFERARMIEGMKRSGQKHLVIVRYGQEHWVYQEWVYNEADIDRAEVVWARDMADVAPLLEYFKDRVVWLLDVNAGHATLSPYDVSQRSPPPR